MAGIITGSVIEVWMCNSFLIKEMLTKPEWLYHIHSQHNFVIIAGINTSTWHWGTLENPMLLPFLTVSQFLYTGNPFYLHFCRKPLRKAKDRLKFVFWYWANPQKSKGEYCFLVPRDYHFDTKSYDYFYMKILKKWIDHQIYPFCTIFQRCQ